MTIEKKEKVERLLGGYQAMSFKKEVHYMDKGKKEGKKIEKVIEGYQPKKDTIEKRGYQPQSSGEQPKPPQGGTGAQKPKK